ncbi:hypothetical protein AAHA92_29345 [Salvia divinorum]|uniref:Reverse transcriptase n=1 Tax=Salvia divinorum TaxID=28513 RepID=A0ABD1FY37_SALDI
MSRVHINVPLVEVLQQIPNYAKFLKDVVAKKRNWGNTRWKLNIDSIRPTSITLQMADRSVTTPRRIVEDLLEDKKVTLILGRPFLATGGAMIDVQKGELTLRLNEESITFNIYDALKFHGKEGAEGYEECSVIQVITDCVGEVEVTYHRAQETLEACLVNSFTPTDDLIDYGTDVCAMVKELDAMPEKIHQRGNSFLPLRTPEEEEQMNEKLKEPRGPPKVELKPLPTHLRYVFLGEHNTYPVVVSAALTEKECDKLVCVLNKHSEWVSPTQVVAKKGGIIVVPGEDGEMIATRVDTGWRVCIDYRMLNAATRKDHFPLPLIDQMLDGLGGYKFYCFLDGYSGYNQIAIAPEDQHKSAFTCPYGTFAYRTMCFSLCNAPATFQRRMIANFHGLIENVMEVFMDDFSVFGKSFDHCLDNLAKVLQRYVETNLVLNWEKCHFMVKEGVVLGHKVSSAGLEVDRAKFVAIEKLPPPSNEKRVSSFLGHAGFDRRFIKDFSKIAKPLCKLLEKDAKFNFTPDWLQAYEELKKALVSAPILIAPDWSQPFEIMCDASDLAIGSALG